MKGNAKDFLDKELTPTLDSLATSKPFTAFVLMSAGIEFLGKGMRQDSPWDDKNHGRKDFDNAMKELFPEKYQQYNTQFKLYDTLRCGLLHIMMLKPGVVLHQSGEHHISDDGATLHLSCEALLIDFKAACAKLTTNKKYSKKLEQDFYEINLDSQLQPTTAATSYNPTQ